MDLMTAVIFGADGTPYHDGLFFFDVFFPDCCPNVPPKVVADPNLYCSGKVCLSLVGTWAGQRMRSGSLQFQMLSGERWHPGCWRRRRELLDEFPKVITNVRRYVCDRARQDWMSRPE